MIEESKTKQVEVNPFKKQLIDEDIEKFMKKLNVEAMSAEDREEKRGKLEYYFKINTRERDNAIKWYKNYYSPINQAKLFLLAYKASIYELSNKVSPEYKKWILTYLKNLEGLRIKLNMLISDYVTQKYRRYLIEDKIKEIIFENKIQIDDFLTITFHNTGVFKLESFGTDEYAESSFASPV